MRLTWGAGSGLYARAVLVTVLHACTDYGCCMYRSNNNCESFHAAVKTHYFPDITSRFISTLPLQVMLPKYVSILTVYDEKSVDKGPMSLEQLRARLNYWQSAHHSDDASPFILHSICSTFQVWLSYLPELEKCCWPDASSFGQPEGRVWHDEVTFVPSPVAAQADCCFSGLCFHVFHCLIVC